MLRKSVCGMLVVTLGLTVGCGSTTTTGGGTPVADAKKYRLDAEPAGAKGVLEVRKAAKDGDPVVLVGRIAGSAKPFVAGRASFQVADLSIKPCPEEEGCPTPWDCCCCPKEELLPATAQVQIAGPDGKTLPVGAKELLGLKELAVVVVEGRARRDGEGNLTVVASGLFVRP